MVINISIYDSVNVTMLLRKRNINTFDALTFMQMHIDQKHECVQVRRDLKKKKKKRRDFDK